MKDSAFDEFYDQVFGNVLGAEDDDNRNAVRKVWNTVIEHIAKQIEFENYEPVSADSIARMIRRMKEHS